MAALETAEEIERAIRKLTPTQRAVFDQICISNDGGHPSRTLKSLEKIGLIVGTDQNLGGRFPIRVRRYHVEFIVHYAWTRICSEEVSRKAADLGMTVDDYIEMVASEGE